MDFGAGGTEAAEAESERLLRNIARAYAATPSADSGWDAALADPAFVDALDTGLADVAAGRVTPYTPPADSGALDVERLADAILNARWYVRYDRPDALIDAVDIAREYAALADPDR
jgi:hypothetical protein